MSDPFDSPKQLIAHARDEIEEAAKLIAEFSQQQQGKNVVYSDPETGQQMFRIKITGPDLSPKVALCVKDAAANLRDALDHAVFSATVAINGGGEPTKTGFPFAEDMAGVQGRLNGRKLADNAPEIRPVLASFNPYEGGNDILWAMNKIRNPNTHRFVVPVGSAVAAMGMRINHGKLNGPSKIGYSHWDPVRKEVEYMSIGPGSHVDYRVNLAMAIVFKGVPVVEGKDVISTLHEMTSETARVVDVIEAETHNIISGRS